MNQTFNTGCQFHKNTVIGQIDNLASYNRVHRIGFRYFFPGICRQLLRAQRYPFLLRINYRGLNNYVLLVHSLFPSLVFCLVFLAFLKTLQ